MHSQPPYRLVAALFVLLLAACDTVDEPDRTQAPAALRTLAEERGIAIGAAVTSDLGGGDAEYRRVLAREFGVLTPENAMKMGPLRPTRTTFNFDRADALVAFAEANEMQIRGHTLVWHNQVPQWVTSGFWSRQTLMDFLRDHITTVVGRYKGRVGAWDVVNEAVADDGTLRNTVWLEKIGPDYIEMAFRWAHEADPDAVLFYNDYGAEGSGRKADAVYALVRELRRNGVPIHGVGLQMHVSTGWAPSAADVAANIERLGDLGLEVHITEMDVRMPLPPTPGSLAEQARVYTRMLETCLTAWNCTTLVLWGFTDRYSWVPGQFNGQGAALVFDEHYDEKPAYQAIRQTLEAAERKIAGPAS